MDKNETEVVPSENNEEVEPKTDETQDVVEETEEIKEEEELILETPKKPDWEAEAKKWKAIAKRHETKAPTPKEFPSQDASKYVTKADFFKANEKTGIKNSTTFNDLDSDETKVMKGEIKDNWSKIVPFVSLRDRTSAENVEEAIMDGYALWKRRNPSKTEDEDISSKAQIAEIRGKGGKTPSPTPTRKKDLFPERIPVTEWYK